MPPVIITLGLHAWNSHPLAMQAAMALHAESINLRREGYLPHLVFCDDGSMPPLSTMFREQYHGVADIVRRLENHGASVGRNCLIDAAIDRESHYLLTVDEDLLVVPGSIVQMVKFLQGRPDLSGCAPHPVFGVRDAAQVSPFCHAVQEWAGQPLPHYLSGYGLFDTTMFLRGIRYDTTGPMGEVGWGFEDDDFSLQMAHGGYASTYVRGFHYYHRLHGSWPSVVESGAAVIASRARREEYYMTKWSKVPTLPGSLNA